MNTKNMSTQTTSLDASSERGVALILALILVTVMSMLAGSLMFLSQTETYSTMNYRMMSQARYGAESGVHAAANYLLNGYIAVEPGTAGDPLANYNMTVSPVTYNNVAVVLSASANAVSNYPVAATVTAFNSAAHGTLAAGNTTVNYAAYATLMSMQPVGVLGGIVQTWLITSDGTITGARTATVEVSSTLDAQILPGIGYGAFATGDGCGSVTMSGNGSTDSYNSSPASYNGVGTPTAANGGLTTGANGGGNVGTNGNMTDSGNATIGGNLYTPRTGVGSCHNGGGGVAGDALSESGNATLDGTVVQLPAAVAIPVPALPNPLPPTNSITINGGSTCASIGVSAPSCTMPGGVLTLNLALSPVSIGNVSLSGNSNLTLVGSPTSPSVPNLNINSISLSGNSTLTIQPGTFVTMDVAGKNPGNGDLSTPIDLSGNGVVSNNFNAASFQIQYAGAGTVNMTGNSSGAQVLVAPNAAVGLSGNGNFYGAIISNTFVDTGNGTLNYDRNLSSSMFVVAGAPWLTSFTWKKS
jgi:hypothetical protein